ncbi:Fc.00g090230.m01.CDS01 [Cosmosporella sp. VM-42]
MAPTSTVRPEPPTSQASSPVPSVIHTPRSPRMSDSTMRSPHRTTRSQVQTIRAALRGRRGGIVDRLLSLDEDRGERPIDDLLRGLGGYLPSLPEAELSDLLDAEIKAMDANLRAERRKRKAEARNKRLTQEQVGSPSQENAATAEKTASRSTGGYK